MRKPNKANKVLISSASVLLLSPSLTLAIEPGVLSERYRDLRAEFLNIDARYFSEVLVSAIESDDKLAHEFGLKMGEKNDGIWDLYGARHTCTGEYNTQTRCWTATGGTKGAWRNPTCGSKVTTYNNLISNPGLTCQEKNIPWSGWEFWANGWGNYKFVNDNFPGAKKIPLNRLCVEVEFDKNNVIANTTWAMDPKHSQIVNPNKLHQNLRYLGFNWGTYTSPITRANGGTGDEELGGTYQYGGSHFYHNGGFSNQQPMDRVYAVDEDTVVACIGPNPNGVRSGMRPTYAANPLLTIAGDDPKDGLTNAYSYINYLTRVYFRYSGSANVNYPWVLKLNRFWMLYERNDVFAMGKRGSVLGLEMIQKGETAYHPFTVYNWAEKDRSYKVFMSATGITALHTPVKHYKVYADLNNNKKVDANEPVIKPYQVLTFKAKQHYSFIIAHTPDFDRLYLAPIVRHGHKLDQSTITFQEQGRLRSASYATRTWLGTAAEIKNKTAFFAKTTTPGADSLYTKFANYNQGNKNNPGLIRNSPDFKRALIAFDNANSSTPKPKPKPSPKPVPKPKLGKTDIFDNPQSQLTAGRWPLSRYVKGYYGNEYRYSPKGNGERIVTWPLTKLKAARYKVYAHWTSHSRRATNTPYTILHRNGQTTVRVNQRKNHSQWYLLGEYELDSSSKIKISNHANGDVIADAVRTVLVAGIDSTQQQPKPKPKPAPKPDTKPRANPNPGVTLKTYTFDNRQGTATSGRWNYSSYFKGYYGRNYQYQLKGKGDKVFTWPLSKVNPARYKVYARWSTSPTRATNAPYRIQHKNGQKVVHVNQRNNNGQWYLLGEYELNQSSKIQLSNRANGCVIADAIRIVPSNN